MNRIAEKVATNAAGGSSDISLSVIFKRK